MMNRSSPDPYNIPSIMSFANLESTNNSNNSNTSTLTPQKSHLWDHFDTQPNFTHTYPNPPASFDPQLSFALPINPNFPFYPSPVQVIAEYNPVVKREEGMSMNIGLNLGHRTYFSSGDGLTVDRLLASRAHYQHPPRCQVEGCRADLAGAKHYHRRHKVCEFHSKAGVVMAGGMQQRFCQQCSRFHVLTEFDESKRSCRKRLADHNRRRRKPEPQSQSNSNDKTKHTARTSKDTSRKDTSKITTPTTTTTTTTTSSGLLEGNQGNQSREMLFRKGPALSFGELNRGPQQQQQQQQIELYNYQKVHHNSNNSDSTSSFYHHHHHQGLFEGSSSNEASQSTSQAMFEVDFI